ncbi:hypothetical protein AcW1_004729 [Taiwanofungus camphoratus]|nr:hypothetical protein AcV7_003473 [Antrodia cinnamomea]KAI0960119.1 hypothetical protein AcW1_004729 [Antrodia cinnamomea]
MIPNGRGGTVVICLPESDNEALSLLTECDVVMRRSTTRTLACRFAVCTSNETRGADLFWALNYTYQECAILDNFGPFHPDCVICLNQVSHNGLYSCKMREVQIIYHFISFGSARFCPSAPQRLDGLLSEQCHFVVMDPGYMAIYLHF